MGKKKEMGEKKEMGKRKEMGKKRKWEGKGWERKRKGRSDSIAGGESAETIQ